MRWEDFIVKYIVKFWLYWVCGGWIVRIIEYRNINELKIELNKDCCNNCVFGYVDIY